MKENSISIRPSGGGVGAFVEGLKLSQHLSDSIAGMLRSALGEHGVLFFRDQDLTPDQHIAFAKTFGPININRFFTAVKGYPQIAEVRKEPDEQSNIGNRWHSDHSYDAVPALGSVLLARETPQEGGDTLFASMFRAYDTLSNGLKKTVEQLRAVHSSRHVFGRNNAEYYKDRPGLAERFSNADAAIQDSIHPLVICHPISNRKALYVNPSFTVGIEGWNDEESAPLLNMLYRHVARPEHTYRYHWAPGSIAFWDNRATWHYAVNDYHGSRRLMHRITIEGVPLELGSSPS